MTHQTNTDSNDWIDERLAKIMSLAEPYMNRKGKGLDEDWQEFIATVQNTSIEMKAHISKHYIPKANKNNEKTPEGVSPSDKILYLHSIINKYEIKHPKPSISRNTAKKMLTRDVKAYVDEMAKQAFRAGQLDCQKAGDPTNHAHFKESVDEMVREAELHGRLHETIEAFQFGAIDADVYSKRHAALTDQISQLSTNKKGEE